MRTFFTLLTLMTSALFSLNAAETDKVITLKDFPIIVTHAEETFDESRSAFDGLTKLTRNWQKGKVVALYSQSAQDIYIDQHIDEYIYSEGGEYRANFETDNIILVGGYLGYNFWDYSRGCLTSTIADTVMFHTKTRSEHTLTVNLISDATYYYENAHQINPSNWKELLLNPFDAFFEPNTLIGGGALPAVKGHEFFYWPPEETWRRWHGNKKEYRPSKREGHINTVSLDNYTFTLLYDGMKKETWGHGTKNVVISVWSDVTTFLKNHFN